METLGGEEWPVSMPPQNSEQPQVYILCHRNYTPGIVEDWQTRLILLMRRLSIYGQSSGFSTPTRCDTHRLWEGMAMPHLKMADGN